MRIVFALSAILCFILGFSDALAKQIKHTIVKGKVTKVTDATVTIKDKYGQLLKLKRAQLPKKLRPKVGKSIQVPHEVVILPPARLKWPDFDKLDEEQKREYYSAIVSFMATIDMNTIAPNKTYVEATPRSEPIWLDSLLKLVIEEAYADRNNICFYAGWRSIRNRSGECIAPWNRSARPTSGYTPCGNDTTYRCNPLLFGRGDYTSTSITQTSPTSAWVESSTLVRDTQNPSAGICVEADDEDLSLEANRARIVLKCLEATRHHVEEVISSLSSQEKRSAFRALRDEINHFCDQHYSSNSSGTADVHASHVCTQLTMRLERLNFATQGANKECRVIRNEPSRSRHCPRSILLQCQQGGQYFLGYVGRYDQTRLSRTSASKPLAQWEAGQVLTEVENRKFTHLYTLPCAYSARYRVNRSERCLFDFRQNMNVPLNTFGNSNCQGGTCLIKAQCLGINPGSEHPATYDVMTACRCDLVEEANMSPHLSSEVARSCLRDRIPEDAPTNFQEFLPPAESSGGSGSSDR